MTSKGNANVRYSAPVDSKNDNTGKENVGSSQEYNGSQSFRKVEQKTDGRKSPAIISGGNVTIEYEKE